MFIARLTKENVNKQNPELTKGCVTVPWPGDRLTSLHITYHVRNP